MDPEINSSGMPSEAAVKLEYNAAFVALRQGNRAKALRMMKDLASKYENTPLSALILRAYASLCLKVALITDDSVAKKWHKKNALDYAKTAAGLCPNSIDYAYFYAFLLFDSAKHAEVYDAVIQECERALSIEDPVGRGDDDSPPGYDVRSRLCRLINKSNTAIVSRWMNGDKSPFFSAVRALVDPIELRRVHANGVKTVDDKPDPRRKGVEVRISTDRLMQQLEKSKKIKEAEVRRKEIEARVSAARLMLPGGGAEESINEMREVVKMCEEWKEEVEKLGSDSLVQDAEKYVNETRDLLKEAEEKKNELCFVIDLFTFVGEDED